MAWGSGRAAIVQSLPLLFTSCTKTEHSAISVLTHSCMCFPFPLVWITFLKRSIILIIVHMYMCYVRQLDEGFASFISNKIPCPCFCCTRWDLTLYCLWQMKLPFRCNVLPQCGFIPEGEKKTAVFSNNIHYSIIWCSIIYGPTVEIIVPHLTYILTPSSWFISSLTGGEMMPLYSHIHIFTSYIHWNIL